VGAKKSFKREENCEVYVFYANEKWRQYLSRVTGGGAGAKGEWKEKKGGGSVHQTNTKGLFLGLKMESVIDGEEGGVE